MLMRLRARGLKERGEATSMIKVKIETSWHPIDSGEIVLIPNIGRNQRGSVRRVSIRVAASEGIVTRRQ